MPVTINEIESQIQVEAPASHGEAARPELPAEAQQRWQEMARREAQREARTSAWGFDD